VILVTGEYLGITKLLQCRHLFRATIRTVHTNLPKIIQGGMGAGVSNWRLQDGDPGGHLRRGLD
jgi:hypothetical protein